jgi:hypothetical protein
MRYQNERSNASAESVNTRTLAPLPGDAADNVARDDLGLGVSEHASLRQRLAHQPRPDSRMTFGALCGGG